MVQLPAHYPSLSTAKRKAVREAYQKQQGGRCAHCRMPLASIAPDLIKGTVIDWRYFPPNFLGHPVHLHHDHKTGMTIGAVHAMCNAVLWQKHGK